MSMPRGKGWREDYVRWRTMEELFERARGGDRAAWDTLVAHFARQQTSASVLDRLLQVVIALLTIPGFYLVGSLDPDEARWGLVVSLLAQPFWLVATVRKRQFGMFAVALVTTLIWMRGVYTHFF